MYIVVVMVVILNNFSFQSARCMLSFRDAGIRKQEPLCMAIITVTVDEKDKRNKRKQHTLSVKDKRKQHTLSVFLNLFSVAVGRVRPNIKLIDTCGSRLIASSQLLNTIF